MNGEKVTMRKEAVMVSFKVTFQHSAGKSAENYEEPLSVIRKRFEAIAFKITNTL
jgi:hypothetical protein